MEDTMHHRRLCNTPKNNRVVISVHGGGGDDTTKKPRDIINKSVNGASTMMMKEDIKTAFHDHPPSNKPNSSNNNSLGDCLLNLMFTPKGYMLVLTLVVVFGSVLVSLDNSAQVTKAPRVAQSVLKKNQQASGTKQKFQGTQHDRKERVLLTSMVFGEKYIEQRRFQMFVKTFATSGFDLAIIGHPAPSYELPPNIYHIDYTWAELVDKIVDKIFGGPTGLDAHKIQALKETIPYKSCDFRALFGYMFADELEGYQWWGYIDNDSLVGNLAKIFPDEELAKWDVVSGTVQKATGPFQLWRNTPAINNLFWKVTEYETLERIILDTQYQSFDEWGQLGKKEASIDYMVEKHAPALGLRYTSNLNRMWDQGECEQEWTFLGLRDDPQRKDCGECIYDSQAPDGRILTRGRDNQEMFFCHYEGGKAYQEDSLADDDVFSKFKAADKFRVTYWHGFDFVHDSGGLFDPLEAQKLKPKRVLLTAYIFGKTGNQLKTWMFFKTAATMGFDLAIIGNKMGNLPLPHNFHWVDITWDQFVDRVSEKVFPNGDAAKIAALRAAGPEKVDDFKPLFPTLFPEEVEGYEWWGHIDTNTLVGGLSTFFPEDFLANYDIVSGSSGIPTWGPLTFYRNTPTVNNLYQKATDLESVLLNPKYMRFDDRGMQETNFLSMSSLVKKHAQELQIRVGEKDDVMWDKKECDANYRKDDSSWHPLDDPEREDCGECVFQTVENDGKQLTRSRDDKEVYLCYYEHSPSNDHEGSLMNHLERFRKLYITEKMRVTYKKGFDFAREDDSKLKESWEALQQA